MTNSCTIIQHWKLRTQCCCCCLVVVDVFLPPSIPSLPYTAFSSSHSSSFMLPFLLSFPIQYFPSFLPQSLHPFSSHSKFLIKAQPPFLPSFLGCPPEQRPLLLSLSLISSFFPSFYFLVVLSFFNLYSFLSLVCLPY